MAQDYTIARISPEQRNWNAHGKDFITYKVKFTGDDEPVEINRLASSEPPKEGEQVYGTISESSFGRKFKAERKEGFRQARDDTAIRAQFAIKAAIELGTTRVKGQELDFAEIESIAKQLFAMVERVKTGVQPTVSKNGYESFKKAGSKLKEDDESLYARIALAEQELKEEPVNLDGIPF